MPPRCGADKCQLFVYARQPTKQPRETQRRLFFSLFFFWLHRPPKKTRRGTARREREKMFRGLDAQTFSASSLHSSAALHRHRPTLLPSDQILCRRRSEEGTVGGSVDPRHITPVPHIPPPLYPSHRKRQMRRGSRRCNCFPVWLQLHPGSGTTGWVERGRVWGQERGGGRGGGPAPSLMAFIRRLFADGF